MNSCSNSLDSKLKSLVRRYGAWDGASPILEFEDMLQVARIAAWQSRERYRADGGSSRDNWALLYANRAVLTMRQREWTRRRLVPIVSYDGWTRLDKDKRLAGRDFAPMLIDCLSPPAAKPNALTRAELIVLKLMCSGKHPGDVAALLRCSKRTVDFHLLQVYKRLQVDGLLQAYNRAMEMGLVEPPRKREGGKR